jgi:hypothetical protein
MSRPEVDKRTDFERQFDQMRRRQEGVKASVGTGFPATGLLEAWGRQLFEAFGEMPYVCGTSFYGKNWRDVDVRIMLDDEKWLRLIGTDPDDKTYQHGATWNALCISISLWGQKVTGLPIDFQFQPWARAIERYGDYPRNAIGLSWEKTERRTPHDQ